MNITIRPWRRETELGFVASAIAKHLRHTPMTRILPDGVLFRTVSTLLDRLTRPEQVQVADAEWLADMGFDGDRNAVLKIIEQACAGVQVDVAQDPEDENHLYGFIVHEPGRVYWVYTKSVYRGLGVAKQLLAHAGV